MIAICLVLICVIDTTVAAPTKEFYFEDQKPESKGENKKTVVLTKEASTKDDLDLFFKDQQHLTNGTENALSDLHNVGQSNNAILSALGQLPYGSQLQDLYQMYTILQSIGINPSQISQMIINGFSQQMGR